MTEEAPKVLGRYQIQAELGRGMMGVVYRASDPDLGRLVALKTIKLAFPIPESEKAAFEKRFLAEARAAAGLQHPGIVVVHDMGRDAASGTVFIALEYLEGRTLAEATADGGTVDWREALRITEKLADALHHAHARGIVHRDIKPANIMVVASSGQPKIMDFGIARLPASTLTTAGEFFGTPSFMSPEQAGGQTALDGRSDLFSLGCVLYQLLTGKRAFDGGTLPAILMRVMREDPLPPSQMAPGLPASLDVLVAKALAKDKEHRYQTGQQMAEDIQDLLADRPLRHAGAGAASTAAAEPAIASDRRPGQGVGARPPEGPGPAGRRIEEKAPASRAEAKPEAPKEAPRRRRLLLVGALGALALVLTVGLGYELLPRRGSMGFPKAPSFVPPARMEITLVHSLESGQVVVWVDDEMVLEHPLEGRVTRKLLNFRVFKGAFSGAVDVGPGEHTVRVEVTGQGFGESKRIRGGFASGTTRLLRAEVTPWPKRDLQLSWGS